MKLQTETSVYFTKIKKWCDTYAIIYVPPLSEFSAGNITMLFYLNIRFKLTNIVEIYYYTHWCSLCKSRYIELINTVGESAKNNNRASILLIIFVNFWLKSPIAYYWISRLYKLNDPDSVILAAYYYFIKKESWEKGRHLFLAGEKICVRFKTCGALMSVMEQYYYKDTIEEYTAISTLDYVLGFDDTHDSAIGNLFSNLISEDLL